MKFLGISWVAACSSAFGKMLQATHDSRHLMLIDAAGDPRQWTYLKIFLKKTPW
jgi:hypothetical protein